MESVVTTVLAMSKDAFHILVNDDIRGVAPDHLSLALREASVADRWYNALVSMKRNTESQLANDKAERAGKKAELFKLGNGGQFLWTEYVAERERWRSGAIRFKNGVEDKISEAKQVRKSHYDSGEMAIERDILITRLAQMRLAIMEHREAVEDLDEVDPRDLALWSVAERAFV
jgi:hypothetical protein